MIVAVTGATGIVGRFVCDYFLELGYEVRGLHRPNSQRSGFVRSPDWVSGDLDDKHALALLLDGADAVVHCAFSHVAGRYRGGEGDDLEGFWRINMGGTLRLLDLARQLDVQRVVLLSSRAVFARRRAEEDLYTPITDDHPLWPDTQYGALKAAQEALACASTDLIVSALRPTGIYGICHPVETSKWYDLVTDVLRGIAVTQDRTATEVHGRDVADAVRRLLQSPPEQVQGRGFNCSDLSLTTRDLVARIARIANCNAHLPNANHMQENPLRCDALRALGWSPQGVSLLDDTLTRLVKVIHDSRQ